MGLKTTNYVSKSTGIHLSVAYAVLKTLVIESDNRARAIFAVQTDRENANTFKPIDKVEVHFKWDRKTNPAEMAYEAAKAEQHTREEWNPETEQYVTITENGILYGWDNDIV